MAQAATKMRGSSDAATRYKSQLEEAGFVNVQEIVYKWPTNRWPRDKKYKELGKLSSPKASWWSWRIHLANDLICKGCG
jgi:hypothetical protein